MSRLCDSAPPGRGGRYTFLEVAAPRPGGAGADRTMSSEPSKFETLLECTPTERKRWTEVIRGSNLSLE